MMLTYHIDEHLDYFDEFIAQGSFMAFGVFGTPDFEKKFTPFIEKQFPAYLEKIERSLSKWNKPYLLSDSMTLADIFLAAFMIGFPYNEELSYCHILQ